MHLALLWSSQTHICVSHRAADLCLCTALGVQIRARGGREFFVEGQELLAGEEDLTLVCPIRKRRP